MQSLVSKSKHVPFRNSKLTYLLQDSLGGESKALMLVCSSPCTSDASETVCSLNFASRVRNVELGPAKRKGGGDMAAEMKLKDKEREIEALREEKARAESAAAKIESKFKDLQCQLHDSQQAAAGAVRQGRAATANGVVEHESDVVAAKDAEIASLRALLAAGGGAGAKDEDALRCVCVCMYFYMQMYVCACMCVYELFVDGGMRERSEEGLVTLIARLFRHMCAVRYSALAVQARARFPALLPPAPPLRPRAAANERRPSQLAGTEMTALRPWKARSRSAPRATRRTGSCVYVCMCVCTHTCTHTHTHMYVRTTRAHTRTHTHNHIAPATTALKMLRTRTTSSLPLRAQAAPRANRCVCVCVCPQASLSLFPLSPPLPITSPLPLK